MILSCHDPVCWLPLKKKNIKRADGSDMPHFHRMNGDQQSLRTIFNQALEITDAQKRAETKR